MSKIQDFKLVPRPTRAEELRRIMFSRKARKIKIK